MRCTEKDLARAQSLARTHLSVAELQDYEIEAVAQLIAEVRRETIEECIRIVRPDVADMVIRRLRALLDAPKAACSVCGRLSGRLIAAKPVKPEPRCRKCGLLHLQPEGHDFEPEEPGHE